MAFNFPDAPANGALFTPPGGAEYIFADSVWRQVEQVDPPLIGAVFYDSKAQVEASLVDGTIDMIMLHGYLDAGDGGRSQYRRSISEPAHLGKIQSADGAWWELEEVNEVNHIMFGGIADGVTPADTAWLAMNSYIYAKRMETQPDGHNFKTAFPRVRVPRGRTLLTQVHVMSDGISGSGLNFIGYGADTSSLIYDNASVDVENHALTSTTLHGVSFQDMTIHLVQPTSKFIKWYAGSSAAGSKLRMSHLFVTGDYRFFVDIQGTQLGSETYFEYIIAGVPAAGSFFHIASTNPQSVNHLFINCTIGSYVGGKIFELYAGGNIKWFGGYSSFGDGSTFIYARNPSGAGTGSGNEDISIYGWHPEIISGHTGDIKIVDARVGYFLFDACNFSQMSIPVGVSHYVFETGTQSEAGLTFRNSFNPKGISMDMPVSLVFDGCKHADWETIVNGYNRLEATNYLSPRISIVNRQNGPDADPFFFERYPPGEGGVPVAPQYGVASKGRSVSMKRLLWRSGTIGTVNGLTVNDGNVYGAFNIIDTIPVGSVVTAIWVVFNAGHSSYGNASERRMQLKNYDGSITFPLKLRANDDLGAFVTEPAFTAVAPVTYRTADLWHRAYDTNSKTFNLYMLVNQGSGANSHDEYGYVMVDYY